MAFLLTVQRCCLIIVTEKNSISHYFCHPLFIVCPVNILVGRGARMRGEEPQGEESRRFAPVSPLPKVLPLALPAARAGVDLKHAVRSCGTRGFCSETEPSLTRLLWHKCYQSFQAILPANFRICRRGLRAERMRKTLFLSLSCRFRHVSSRIRRCFLCIGDHVLCLVRCLADCGLCTIHNVRR